MHDRRAVVFAKAKLLVLLNDRPNIASFSLVCCATHAGEHRRIFSAITNLKNRLVDIIEPDFGLLDELLSLEVLSRRQYNKVRSGDKAVYERSDAVLDLLTSEDHCAKFLKALQRTGQQHIVNFIVQNGGQKHILNKID